MDSHSFLFVVCVNDESLYSRCKSHIMQLTVPPSYSVDIMPIYDSASMASSYNKALKHPSKYKIYLHQDTFIIHQHFLHDMLHIFQSHQELGLLGVAGCKTLPPNGIWWESGHRMGKVIEYRGNAYHPLDFEHGDEDGLFTPAAAIDGLLMAAQYDVEWREDLFRGFHFYDTSQSLEFQKHGYQVGVACQKDPWCLHFCGDSFDAAAYEADRQTFVKHYMAKPSR